MRKTGKNMKISSSFNSSYRISKNRESFKALHPNPVLLPESLGKMGKWAGEYVSMPEQKLFLATTAFMFQPVIDMQFAEEDKKSDVAIKSAAKAIAGGITGVAIRGLFEKYITNAIKFDEHGVRSYKGISRYLFPPKAEKMRKISPSAADVQLKKYASTLGVMASLLVMILVTNEQLDVPITSDLQDLFTGVARDNKTFDQSLKDVANARLDKMKSGLQSIKDFFADSKIKSKKILQIAKEPVNKEVKQ